MSEKTIIIDYLPTKALLYRTKFAIIAIDVIRATTTATTAINFNRQVFPAESSDEAFIIGSQLENPLYVGEMGGNVPYGFDLTNSPVQVAALSTIPTGQFTDINRPIILVSSSGTPLILNASGSEGVYIACARNFIAVANYVAQHHKHIAIIGAGTRGQFRCEDQMVCAWLGERLLDFGYKCENEETNNIIIHWKNSTPTMMRKSESAEYLRRSGQNHDLEFIIHHINDLNVVPKLIKRELVDITKAPKHQ